MYVQQNVSLYYYIFEVATSATGQVTSPVLSLVIMILYLSWYWQNKNKASPNKNAEDQDPVAYNNRTGDHVDELLPSFNAN